MCRLATNGKKLDRHRQQQTSRIKSRLPFETENKQCLTDNGLYLYRTSCAVRSGITATTELLVQ